MRKLYLSISTGSTNHYASSTDYQVYLSDNTGTTFILSGSVFNVSASYSTTDGITTIGLTHTFTIPAGSATGSDYEIAIGPLQIRVPFLMPPLETVLL